MKKEKRPNAEARAAKDMCPVMGVEERPSTIIVRQVVGSKEKQKVLDINITVPPSKPSIEQVIDAFVKDLEVTDITVITDKVIVRGEFDVKAIYVACLPEQPVHAVELRNLKFTQDVEIPGTLPGMDAEATVKVEFVDVDTNENNDHCECEEECTRELTVSVVIKINAKVFAEREVTIMPPAPTVPGKPKG